MKEGGQQVKAKQKKANDWLRWRERSSTREQDSRRASMGGVVRQPSRSKDLLHEIFKKIMHFETLGIANFLLRFDKGCWG